jgi:hypothetical protein
LKISLRHSLSLLTLAAVCVVPAVAHADLFSFTYTAYTYGGSNSAYSANGLLFGTPDASIAGAFDITSGFITPTGIASGLFSGTGVLYQNPTINSFVNDPLVGGLGYDDVLYPGLYPQLNNGLLFVDAFGHEILITNGLMGHQQSPAGGVSQANPSYEFFLSDGPAPPVVICSAVTTTDCVQYNYDPLIVGVSSGQINLAGIGTFSASHTPAPTSEPSSLILLGTGLAGLGGLIRRRIPA